MFLALEHPGFDKSISILAQDLKDDEGFDPCRHQFLQWDSDRSRANRAITAVNVDMRKGHHKPFPMLINQFAWVGTTGWEYWSDDCELMLKHALLVAAALNVPLHVHIQIWDKIEGAAQKSGISLKAATAPVVEHPHNREFMFTNKDLQDGKYVVLSEVVLPPRLPSPPEL